MEKSAIDWIAIVLLIIGGLNWGLVGVANFNLVTTIFGSGLAANIVYDLVGLSAIWSIIMIAKKK